MPTITPVINNPNNPTLQINTNAGPQGPVGQGVPAAGLTGQALVKKTSTNYDTEWTYLIKSINGLEGMAHQLAVGSAGNDFSINSSGTTHTFNIPSASAVARGLLSASDWQAFNSKQVAGNYITALTGEAVAAGPGSAAVVLDNGAVISKVLTGLNIAAGTITSTDSILSAFGKLQGTVSTLVGGVKYMGTWNASTNTPAISSSTGTKGNYYVVSVNGSTAIDGISDWKMGDWIIFNGTSWEKVDNTDSVVSVNGYTGVVTLTTSDVAEGTRLYYTDARARAAITLTTTGTSGAATYSGGVLNIPQYQATLTNPVTGTGTTNYIAKFTGTSAVGNSLIQDNGTSLGFNAAPDATFRFNFVQTSAAAALRIKGGTANGQGASFFVTSAGSSQTLLAIGDRATAFGGTVDQAASIYTGPGIPLIFDMAGGERARITPNGNVSIGNTNDTYKLDISGTLRNTTDAYFATSSGGVGIGTTTSPGTKTLRFANLGAVRFETVLGSTSGYLASVGDYDMQLGNNNATLLFERVSGNWVFNSGGTGNVGIGNTSPLALLHVGNRNSTGSTDPLILASRTINSGSGNSRGFSDSTNYARSGGTSYASYDARIEMTGTNNFGHYAAFQAGATLNFTGTITDVFNYISAPTYTSGTITNSYGTYVQNPVKTGATLTNNYGHYIPSVFNAGTNNWVWYNASTARSYSAGDTISRKFYAGSNSVAVPDAQFHAEGTGDVMIRIQQTGWNFWDFKSVSSQTYLTIGDVSGTYATFFNLGNVAIGTTTNNGYKFDVQGTFRNTTDAYFATSSGNVGIGTTSTSYKLDVRGVIRSSDRITAVGEYRLNDATFMRVAKNDDGGAISGGYNLDVSAAGVVSHAATGSIAGYKYDSIGAIRFYTGSSQSAGTAATEKVTITSAGDIGIGTNSPTAPLHIIKTAGSVNSINIGLIVDFEATAAEQAGAGTAIEFRGKSAGGNTPNYSQAMIATNNDGTNNSHGLSFYTKPNGATALTERARLNSNGTFSIGNTNATYNIDVSGTLRNTTSAYFATSSGNVSIGTTGANGKLFVVDDVNSDVNINFQNNNAGTSARVRLGFASAAGTWYLSHARTGGNFSIFNETSEFVTIARTTGNFGIGTTSPAGIFHVQTGNQEVGRFVSTNVSGPYLVMSYGATPTTNAIWGAYPATSGGGANFAISDFMIRAQGHLIISTGGASEKMVLFQNGNLAVGTVADNGYKLDVQGTLRATSTITAGGDIWIASGKNITTSSSTGSFFIFGGGTNEGGRINLYGGSSATNPGTLTFLSGLTGGAVERMRLQASGNFSIGNTNDTYKLDVSGTLRNTTSSYFATSSGSVGIGNTNPLELLQVGAFTGSNTVLIGADPVSGFSSVYFGDGTGTDRYSGYLQYEHANDAMVIGTNKTEKVRVTSAGYLGIGITPTAHLHVNGGFRTAAPTGGTAATWKFGAVATVTPTSQNRTIEVEIGGTTYYLTAKTTND